MVVTEGLTLERALYRAARQAGVRLPAGAPRLETLRAAIDSYRALFQPQQLERLRDLRQQALSAMRTFAAFAPRLSGSAVHGDGPLDRVRLLLHADPPEQVMMSLDDRYIPWRSAEVQLTHGGGRRVDHPAIRFQAGGHTIELVILAPGMRSDPPREPLGGSPLDLLDTGQLESLVAE